VVEVEQRITDAPLTTCPRLFRFAIIGGARSRRKAAARRERGHSARRGRKELPQGDEEREVRAPKG
jgi:hypothetical protein